LNPNKAQREGIRDSISAYANSMYKGNASTRILYADKSMFKLRENPSGKIFILYMSRDHGPDHKILAPHKHFHQMISKGKECVSPSWYIRKNGSTIKAVA